MFFFFTYFFTCVVSITFFYIFSPQYDVVGEQGNHNSYTYCCHSGFTYTT